MENPKMELTHKKSSRRSMIKSMFATVMAAGAGMFGLNQSAQAKPSINSKNGEIKKFTDEQQQASGMQPLFSGVVVHNGLAYVSGKGEHSDGDITDHTVSVLNQIEEELEKVGSSMDKALKVNVYLHDIRDYDAMNAAYRGRFGDNPPVRTTVACYGGIPGSSLVEIDCIAAL